MGSRRFRVLKKLGEGGYAVVYLVSEIATTEQPEPDPEPRALKRVLVHSPEQFDAVQQEMLVHTAVQHHPNILPLLDYCCSEGEDGGAGSSGSRCRSSRSGPSQPAAVAPGAPALLTPPTPVPPPPFSAAASPPPPTQLAGAVGLSLPSARSTGGAGTPEQRDRVACFLFPVFRDGTLASELERLSAAGELLPTADVLSVFGQMARAVAHIHAHGYSHRDIKPLNVLIASNPDRPAPRQQGQHRGRPQAGPGRPHAAEHTAADVEAAVALKSGTAEGAQAGPRYRCVVMDFGSARPRELAVTSRSQALQVQEDAEAHCSAPYRAPELFDVPSPAPLDFAAADVWSLGASLFHLMYGEPPFQRAISAAGGSLALAVINCAIGWPRPPAPAYPPQLHQLVQAAMAPAPAARPSAAQLAEMAAELALRGLPDPAPQPKGSPTTPRR